MTLLIKIFLILSFILTTGGYTAMNNSIQSKKTKFIFYTAFIDYKDETVPMQITVYSDQEVTNKYQNKLYYLDLNKCKLVSRIREEDDLDYFEEYTNHFYHLKSSQMEIIKNLLKLNHTRELKVYLKSIGIEEKEYQAIKYRFYTSQYIFDKLNLEPKIQKYCNLELDDFYGIDILDDKYFIGYDGGYVIVFKKSEETQNTHQKEEEIIRNNTFTSPITTETHNYIPDDFFVKN